MVDYAKLADLAERLINGTGRTMTLRTVSKTGVAWNPTVSTVDTSITGTMVNFDVSKIKNTLIKIGDKTILVAAKSTTITKDDVIIDGGLTYTVKKTNLIAPGSTSLLYKLLVSEGVTIVEGETPANLATIQGDPCTIGGVYCTIQGP